MTSKLIALPIDEKIPQILQALKTHSNLVLSASPGAGKTTRLPPALLQLTEKQVWVLEPRRMAAIAASHRIAEEQGWSLGEEVGYQVRFENKTNVRTRLVFLTEALLARKILQDPELKNVGIIVLDEFHERSIHVDLALGLLKELQMLARPDLKIVVMSATLNARPLAEFLDQSPVVEVPGKLFELQIQKSKPSQILRTDFQFIQRVVDSIKSQVIGYPDGKDILVFLPGLSEISRTQKGLEDFARDRNLLVLPLSGSLGITEQMRALQPAAQRKIILSTNVAESSVTIEGIDTVIDSGLARILRKHPKTDFEQLVTARISKASAKQRAGRAARQWPGRCLQLWNIQDELSMSEFDAAEVATIDLTQTVLFLKAWGATDLLSFSWFEKPSAKELQKCEAWLEKIGALKNNALTPHGKELAKIPLHPRIAQILKVAESLGAGILGCDIAALMEEGAGRDEAQTPEESDLIVPLDQLHARRNSPASKSAEQLKRFLKTNGDQSKEASVDLIGEILLLASPDRLCRRRARGRRQALMVGGRGAELAATSAVKDADFFIALDLMELDQSKDTQIKRATAVPRKLIDQHFSKEFQKKSRMIFDDESKNFFIEEYNSLWDLPLEEPRKRIVQPAEVEAHLPQALLDRWPRVLEENEGLGHWWARWQYFEQQAEAKETFWTNETLLDSLKLACMGENKWDSIMQKDLVYFFESQLDSATLTEFKRQTPPNIEVPTGNKIKIHYHIDKPPHLEVRLQELFGMAHTPTVWDGKKPITLHLLGPNYRPVQMTSDLSSFWKNTYPEVKRELRFKYPKHSWPDDPLTAPAVARGRPRK